VYGDCRNPTFEPVEIIEACGDHGTGVKDISWSSWTSNRATGVGTLWYNDCSPSCAAGQIHYVPNASVSLSKPTQGVTGETVWSEIFTDPQPPGYASGPYGGGPQPLPTQPE